MQRLGQLNEKREYERPANPYTLALGLLRHPDHQRSGAADAWRSQIHRLMVSHSPGRKSKSRTRIICFCCLWTRNYARCCLESWTANGLMLSNSNWKWLDSGRGVASNVTNYFTLSYP